MIFKSIHILIGLAGFIIINGCTFQPTVCGLRPEYPEIAFSGHALVFTKVDSVQPTLRWESFPRPEDREREKDLTDRFYEVTYDLKILQVGRDSSEMRLVYLREALKEPRHRVEEPLMPGAKYYWTVRARFKVNDHVRLTQWGLSELPWPPGPSPCSMKDIPYANYYRFKTPSKSPHLGVEEP